MKRMVHSVAVALVLVLGVLPTTMGAAGGCDPDTGAGSAAGGKPIVELPKDTKKVKYRVTWSPDVAVQIHTTNDGHLIDHGVKHNGSWSFDALATNSAALDARALNHPESLHCDMQVGWTHYEMWAAVDKGEWTCFAHWSTGWPPPKA